MKQYVVDAFTDKVFAGNPAAVCMLSNWPSDDLLMNITRENNLSETAFLVAEENYYHLRWFTPGGEIDLCGHATLGAAYVVTSFIEVGCDTVNFQTLSGKLTVKKRGDLFEMDFPTYELRSVEVTSEIVEAIGFKPLEAYLGRDLVCVMSSEEVVRSLRPDMNKLLALDGLLLHVTAQGLEFDCVSRSFAPKLNVQEDPVCGSGHCHIVPYFAKKLNKNHILAYQASERGGILHCSLDNNRMKLSGKAVLYSESKLYI